jgi:hypothetical protein
MTRKMTKGRVGSSLVVLLLKKASSAWKFHGKRFAAASRNLFKTLGIFRKKKKCG